LSAVYGATEKHAAYALNAATGAQVWKASVPGANETPSDDHGCGQILPQIGIPSPPAIDAAYGPHGAVPAGVAGLGAVGDGEQVTS
jgi:outer membrane protein assembly factor BamB